ncbi:MAG: TRAP transporter large permease, partial [Rhodospirillaceae bacterium]|nr:TRAP transporter large permease [Rhodospirillaceae bacterium]
LFVLMGQFAAKAGLSHALFRAANVWLGHHRGGIAMAAVGGCAGFGAISGSSLATAATMGQVALPELKRYNYAGSLATGSLAAGGTLGILIPPSIVMVVYAAATDVSVGRMFLAGILPGLIAGLMLMIGIYVAARFRGLPSQPWAGWGELWQAARDAIWGLLLIIIILGGIYGGIFTPTEAAAVAAVYAFFIANFVYCDMGPFATEGRGGAALVTRAISVIWHPDTKKTLFDAGKLTVTLMFIIANALILKHVLTEERIPQEIAQLMLSAGLGPIAFLIVVNILLLIGGQFMEPSGLLIIVAPLVFPIAIQLGIDPIHLGIIMVVNMEIGMITPPVGLNLFVTAGVAAMSVMAVVKAALPWVGIMFLFLILVTYVPWISTVIPIALMGPEIITK